MGVIQGSTIRVMQGDTGSLDYGSNKGYIGIISGALIVIRP